MGLVDDHPKMIEQAEKEAALERARQAHKERVTGKVEPYQRDHAQWEQDSREAVAAGQEPPPEPQAPNLGADAFAEHQFIAKQQELRARRRRVLAEIGPELEEQAVSNERARWAKVKKHAAALAKAAQEECDDAQDVRAVREAADPQLARRTIAPKDVTPAVVLDAVLAERSLLALAEEPQQVGPVSAGAPEPQQVGPVSAGAPEPQQRTASMRTNLPRQPPWSQPRTGGRGVEI